MCCAEIPSKAGGRIDRIYCSASCRTLAWRARSGDRFRGRRNGLPLQPGSYVARRALPLLAVRMRAELDAAKQRVAELEKKLGERPGSTRDAVAMGAGGAVAAVAGAVAIAVAVEQERDRVQQAERESARAQVAAEEQRHQAELTAEREQAAQREEELRQQVTALTTRVEEANARERAAAVQVAKLRQDENALHQRLDEESNRIWKMHFELASPVSRSHRRADSSAPLGSLKERLHHIYSAPIASWMQRVWRKNSPPPTLRRALYCPSPVRRLRMAEFLDSLQQHREVWSAVLELLAVEFGALMAGGSRTESTHPAPEPTKRTRISDAQKNSL